MKKIIKIILWDFGGVLTNSPIQNFYEYDHDSKSPYWCPIDENILNECTNLIDKHFPEKYNF